MPRYVASYEEEESMKNLERKNDDHSLHEIRTTDQNLSTDQALRNYSRPIGLGRMPFMTRGYEHIHTKKVNRYLKFQEDRIFAAILCGDTKKAVLI